MDACARFRTASRDLADAHGALLRASVYPYSDEGAVAAARAAFGTLCANALASAQHDDAALSELGRLSESFVERARLFRAATQTLQDESVPAPQRAENTARLLAEASAVHDSFMRKRVRDFAA
jgi:hypothetical protein